VRFDDEPIPPGEEWYYEIDGRAHGPLTRTDLEQLLSGCGDTASEVRIRKGAGGVWTPFRPDVPASAPRWIVQAAGPGGASAAVLRESERKTSAPRGQQGRFRSLIRGRADVIAVVAAWLFVNALFLLFWPQPYARERRYLAALRGIVAEVDELRAQPASDAKWHELAARTRAILAPIARDLEKSASSSELVRQQLLWSARDLAPRIVGPWSKARDGLQRRLKQYLDSVDQQLARV